MEKQYYIYNPTTLVFESTNYYLEQPKNSVDFAPQVRTEFAKVDLKNKTWIDTNPIIEEIKEEPPIEVLEFIEDLKKKYNI